MSRYSSIEWAGKTVRRAVEFLLVVNEQAWDYHVAVWTPVAKTMEDLGIDPLVRAYDAVAEHHDLPAYSGNVFVGGLIGSSNSGTDQAWVRKEMEFISATFNNSMQYMANNPGWQQAQDGMEKVALERLENLIRVLRGFRSSSDEKRYIESHPKVAA